MCAPPHLACPQNFRACQTGAKPRWSDWEASDQLDPPAAQRPIAVRCEHSRALQINAGSCLQWVALHCWTNRWPGPDASPRIVPVAHSCRHGNPLEQHTGIEHSTFLGLMAAKWEPGLKPLAGGVAAAGQWQQSGQRDAGWKQPPAFDTTRSHESREET